MKDITVVVSDTEEHYTMIGGRKSDVHHAARTRVFRFEVENEADVKALLGFIANYNGTVSSERLISTEGVEFLL